MKIATKRLCGTALLSAVCIFGSARAAPITDIVDPVDTTIAFGSTPSPCPSGYTCTTGMLSFLQDISDSGFVPGVDLITSAFLQIHLTDPLGGGSEGYQYEIGGSQTFNSVNVPSGGGGSIDLFNLNVASLADLNADGFISVAIRSLHGSFIFADAMLTAEVTPGAAHRLPEPPPLVLLASIFGAMGLTTCRRS